MGNIHRSCRPATQLVCHGLSVAKLFPPAPPRHSLPATYGTTASNRFCLSSTLTPRRINCPSLPSFGQQPLLSRPATQVANMEWGYGFNAKTLQYENLLEAGVADPASVTTWALENAASISGSLLTTECLITDTERQDDEDADFVPDITTGMGKDVDQYAW